MLPLFALVLILLIVSAAIAVDLSALARRGQTLQNTADAAALAGVATWVETGDSVLATGRINDVINQNGVALGDDVAASISFPDANRVLVELVDDEPDVLMSAVVGIGQELTRNATAYHQVCGEDCERIIPSSPPLGALLAVGSGDGFVPVVVGSRLFGVNHHGTQIGCVDRETEEQCFSAQPLFYESALTADVHYVHARDNLLFYVGWIPSSGDTIVTCFNVLTESRCTTSQSLGPERAATMFPIDDKLYIITSSRKIHCLELPDLANCSGYGGGLDTAVAAVTPWTSTLGAYTSSGVVHDQRIYHVLNDGGRVHMHCWDVGTTAPCGSFGAPHIHNTVKGTFDNYNNGRLFFHRDTNGTPTSICSLGEISVECRDLTTGDRISGDEANLAPLYSATSSREFGTWASIVTYHEGANRIFPTNSLFSITYCYDFNTASYCGEGYNSTSLGITRTYGFWTEPNCLIGLGHESIFFSQKLDLSGPCTAGSATGEIVACSCSGTLEWPSPVALGTTGVAEFNIRIFDKDGDVVVPSDGSPWFDLLSGSPDLSGIDFARGPLTIQAEIEPVAGANPWDGPTPPAIGITTDSNAPKLVE